MSFSEKHAYLAASYMSPHTITFPTNRNVDVAYQSNCDTAHLHYNKIVAVAAVRKHNYTATVVTQWSCIKIVADVRQHDYTITLTWQRCINKMAAAARQ